MEDDLFRTDKRDKAAYLLRHMPTDYRGEEVEEGSRYPTVIFCFDNKAVAEKLIETYSYSIEKEFYDCFLKISEITKRHNPIKGRK